MKLSGWLLGCVFGLALNSAASGQVYESKDAQGVPEFSDTPTAGAEVVELPSTNVADAPGDGPVAPGPEAGSQAAQAAQPNPDGEARVIYEGADDEDEDLRAQRRLTEDRVDKALPGNPVGPGVGAPGAGVEPGRGGVEPARPEVHREAPHR